jgi:(aminoalkyl)phosphonate N-acetyltransferase
MMLRAATLNDLQFVYESLSDLEETMLPYAAFVRVYQTNLANPVVHYVVAETNNVPVGFGSCHVQELLHHAGPVAEIQELYVQPYWRGRGIGQALIQHFIDLGRQQRWVLLEVTSSRRRARTHEFYERLGFTQTSYKFVTKEL